MALGNENSDQLACRLVARITDEQRSGAIGSQNYRELMNVAFRMASSCEDLLKAATRIREQDEELRRARLRVAAEVTPATIAEDNDRAAALRAATFEAEHMPE